VISVSINSIPRPLQEEYTMSKSPIRRKARPFVMSIAGLLASLIAVCAAAPSAFAMRLSPPDESGSAPTVAQHAGPSGWEIALIAIGAALLVGLLIAVARRGRATSRLQRAMS
jgi:hypothetical protein